MSAASHEARFSRKDSARGRANGAGREGERPVAVILGATASGKTSLAVDLAGRLGERGIRLEVIGADARQIYRGISVGTAKPTPEERGAVPHHMIDLVGPEETFNAVRYAAEARRCAEEVYARGAVPLVVGGSGLYLRAFLEGLFEGPEAQPWLRGRLEELADREGNLALHRRLAACDPRTAGRLHPNDRKRVIRALEVYEVTGRPISELQARGGGEAFARPLYVGISWPPEALARRIEARVRWMLAEGMAEEAATLAQAGLTEGTVFEGLGYAEALALHRGEADFEGTVGAICRLHRGYAKRQRTWFRRMRDVRWFDASRMGWEALVGAAAGAVCSYLEGFSSPRSVPLGGAAR